MTGRVFHDKLHVSSFPDMSPHYAWTTALSAHSDFIRSRVYACLGVTCHLHFWQNDWGLLHATAVTWGWNGHRIRVSTQSKLSRRSFSRCSWRDFELAAFQSQVQCSPNKLSWIPKATVQTTKSLQGVNIFAHPSLAFDLITHCDLAHYACALGKTVNLQSRLFQRLLSETFENFSWWQPPLNLLLLHKFQVTGEIDENKSGLFPHFEC